MPRQLRKQKPYVVVFWEGESERTYMDFLKKKFLQKGLRLIFYSGHC